MLRSDQYECLKSDLLKRKTKPFVMSNSEWAGEFFERFKEEYPGASMHVYDIRQYICLDNRARRNLLKQIKQQKEDQEKALLDSVLLIGEIERACDR